MCRISIVHDKYRTLDISRLHTCMCTALMYFLELPRLVFACRNDISGLSGVSPGSAEKFPLRTVLKRIHSDLDILRFCRAALESESAHSVIVSSCIGMMNGTVLVGTATKTTPLIVGGQGTAAISRFLDILGKAAARPNMAAGTVMDAVR